MIVWALSSALTAAPVQLRGAARKLVWGTSGNSISSKLPVCLQACPCLDELDRQGSTADQGPSARANYNTCEVQKAWAQSALRTSCSAACSSQDAQFLHAPRRLAAFGRALQEQCVLTL